jgi:CHAT domain-containing protein/tetratricopeptide (TPR) repeat protein
MAQAHHSGLRLRFVGTLAPLLLGVLLLAVGCGQASPRERVVRVAEGIRWRPPLGRLCCGGAYRPAPPPGAAVESVSMVRLARLYGELTRPGADRASPEVAAALGTLDLMRGDWKAAVERLQEAVRLAPGRADLQSDLSVTLLARGVAEDRPLEILAALRAALQATRLDPTLPEAWFNRGAILEQLLLRREAAKAWSRVLELEGDAEWREEAASRRERTLDNARVVEVAHRMEPLEAGERVEGAEIEALVAAQPHLMRELGEERLLAAWGRETAAGRSAEAEPWLDLAERIGAQLAQQWGDHMLADAVAHARSAEASPAKRAGLAGAYGAYGDGMLAYYGRLFARASADLARAQRGFAVTGSPMAASAALYLAVCTYQEDVEASREPLASVAAEVDPERYPSLAGRTYWMQGIVEMVQGRIESSIGLFERTREWLARSSGPERAAMADLLLAEAFDSRGDVERGWRLRLRAAQRIAPGGDSRKQHAVLQDSVQALVRREQSELALVFLEEEVANALNWGERAAEVEALAQRSRVRSQRGDLDAAIADARRAIAVAEEIADDASRRRVEASARLSLGIALADVDPAESLRILRAAQEEHEQIGWKVERFAFLDASARAHLRLGDVEAARKILELSVNTFEEIRRDAIDVRSRIIIFQHARRAFDLLIELALARGADGVAPGFDLAERSRARYLLDRWQRGGQPAGLQQVAAALADDTVLVHYAVLPERAVAWVVESGQTRLVELEGRPVELERAEVDLRAALEMEQAERSRQLASELYDRLVRPLGLDLDAGRRLVVVPEGWLARVPFAALLDRETEQYLVERAAVAFAPSATLYLQAARVAARAVPERRRALVVGAPELAGSPWAELPALRLAEAEARAVAGLYPEHTLLVGREASVAAFLDGLREAEIVHFAGHAVSRGDELDDSWLLLSGGPRGESGALSMASLWETNLRGTELVVLSACQGLDGFAEGREGVVSLASSFFAAGVPTVVAALWRVDDEASYGLMKRFHELVAGGERPAQALRRVMIEEIQSGDATRANPGRWGVFAVLGV